MQKSPGKVPRQALALNDMILTETRKHGDVVRSEHCVCIRSPSNPVTAKPNLGAPFHEARTPRFAGEPNERKLLRFSLPVPSGTRW